MNYRHEWKHEISYCDLLVLRSRLTAVTKPDSHAINGSYLIRSLYFDTDSDKALREKLDGVSRREKYRIRYYNHDPSVIHLEKKSKLQNLCSKQTAPLSAGQAAAIIRGEYTFLKDGEQPLLREFYCRLKEQQLRPRTIVDYTREAFVYPPGNVRVTLDYDIRTGLSCTDFLNPDCITVPAGDAPIILEVKWDAFLPDIIRDTVQLPCCRTGAFSKYAACRIYG